MGSLTLFLTTSLLCSELLRQLPSQPFLALLRQLVSQSFGPLVKQLKVSQLMRQPMRKRCSRRYSQQ